MIRRIGIILFLWSSFSTAQNLVFQINDTVSYFQDDLMIGLFTLDNKNYLIKVTVNDSTILYKEYKKSGVLISSYTTNLDGYNNGGYYSLNLQDSSKTISKFNNGDIEYSFTVNATGDTIGVEKKVSDSLNYNMQIKNGVKKIWFTDYKQFYTGEYKEFNCKTNVLIKKGEYIIIKETDVIDVSKYREKLKEYGLGEVNFRGKENKKEIPIGTWYFYDSNGSEFKKIKYDWEGVLINAYLKK